MSQVLKRSIQKCHRNGWKLVIVSIILMRMEELLQIKVYMRLKEKYIVLIKKGRLKKKIDG